MEGATRIGPVQLMLMVGVVAVDYFDKGVGYDHDGMTNCEAIACIGAILYCLDIKNMKR